MLSEFNLDSKYINVKGSYGSTPRRVREATEQLVLHAEANPDLWFRLNLTGTGNSLYIDELVKTREALKRETEERKYAERFVDDADGRVIKAEGAANEAVEEAKAAQQRAEKRTEARRAAEARVFEGALRDAEDSERVANEKVKAAEKRPAFGSPSFFK